MTEKVDAASATNEQREAALANAKPMKARAGDRRNNPLPVDPPFDRREEERREDPRVAPAMGLLSELWPDFQAELERRADGSFNPIPTGLRDLDSSLGGGFPRGAITLLPAPPGVGKTTFALWTMLNAAAEGTPVIFWNLELPREDALSRLVSILEGQPWGELRRGLHPGPVRLAGEKVKDFPFSVHGADTCPTIETMEALVNSMAAKFEAKPLLVVDYAQRLMDELTTEERANATLISKSLSDLVKRTGAAAVTISTVGRASYNVMKNGKPDLDRVLGMAKESGQFEYDAVTVLALVAVHESEPDRYKKLWAVTGKNRFGVPGSCVPLEYDGMAGTFREISPEEMPASGGAVKASPEQLREQIRDLVSRRGEELTSMNKVNEFINGRKDRINAMLKAMKNIGELTGGAKKEPFKLGSTEQPDLVLAKFMEFCPEG